MSIFSAPSFYSQADQNIYNQGYSFIPQEQFRSGVFKTPGDGSVENDTFIQPTGITSLGGGGGGAAFTGTTGDLTTAFQKAVDDRQDRLYNAYDNPDMAKIAGLFPAFKQDVNPVDAGEYLAADERIPQQRTMLGKAFMPQSAQEIIEEGYSPALKLGIFSNLLPDRFGTLPRGDQAFIARNMGYTGPTVFGENTSGLSKDIFGLNTRSGFGNYAERVGVEATKLGAQLGGRLSDKYGAEFDEETGMFVGPNAAKANQMTKMMRAKFNFYTQRTKQRDLDRLDAERKLAEEAKAKQMADAAERARLERLGRDKDRGGFDPSGPTQASIRASREDRSGRGQSGGFTNPGKGSYGPFMADGGRVQYMMGGLADLVDIYD